ncbi:unnamed protein product [Didymodactylos carnosus]|uniref:Reverse transcriptase domain-containing protein n=1 Tax=Didymodactylos carnosus TaxID=1234261 RepID=A0A814NT81_9BILA|nr:unnamed protein product [Didymodactylos carnosus]CAF3862300.1 unnamed protein product [Didymodactylos carnosus]
MGFRRGRSCIDNIFCLRQIIEKRPERRAPFYISFVDFKAAFDSVNHAALWIVLESYGIPSGLVQVISNLYKGARCAVRVDGQLTDWFDVSTGVRQGCVLSGILFAVIYDYVMRCASSCPEAGIDMRRQDETRRRILSDLAYADDIALFAESPEKLQIYMDVSCLSLNDE